MITPTAFHLLVIDDDSLFAESIKMILPKGWRMSYRSSYKNIDSGQIFHAAFVDMHLTPSSLSKPEGPQIISRLSQEFANIQLVAMSGDLSVELMEKCLNNGAHKFLAKPLMADEVISTLEKIEAFWQMRIAESQIHSKNIKWIGSSPESQEIKNKIVSLRGEPGPILIEGETGTGKEVAFCLLSQQEPARHAITVNIAAVTENLFESELFGHVKGAFTGADSLKIGLAEAAHGGDLFLDEIEALPLSLQVKLLRFLETGEIRKVGAKESQIIKTRVIIATNQNLAQMVKEGKFREDLLFRISGKKINLPSLRDRPQDISELAEHFLSELRPRSNKKFSAAALDQLKAYHWPGNVRELKRICEQLSLTCPLPIIRESDVMHLIGPAPLQTQSAKLSADLDLSQGLTKLTQDFESQVLQSCLDKTQDIDETAKMLNISRSNLYKKIKDYNLIIGSPTDSKKES